LSDYTKNIAVIGAGKISYSLTNVITKNNYNIKIVVSRRLNSAKKLAQKFKIETYSDQLNDIPAKCSFFLLAVPDSQIKIVAENLSRLKLNFKNSLFVHLSGAHDISLLNSLKNKNAKTASIHIMQTFPTKRIVNIKNSYAAIETKNKNIGNFLSSFANSVDLIPFTLKSENKALYHAAGVFASNFLVGNFFNSEKLFNESKIDNLNFYEMMQPIILSTLQNINKEGTVKALSGPVERGDLDTVKNHLLSIRKKRKYNSNNSSYINYIVQSLSLLNIVENKFGKLNERHLDIKRYLLKELKKHFQHFNF
jgi:predicted short-subunit dehydrogenase-like oxidoreductase (DUF2520 family)